MTKQSVSVASWLPVVEQIRAGSESGVEELYNSLRSVRFFFVRHIGPDRADDAYHSVIIDLIGAIKKGALREPETLPAYAMTIARRKLSQFIGELVRERQKEEGGIMVLCAVSESPEQLVLRSERQAIAKRVFTALPARDQKILTRFYLNGEPAEQIQAAMGLNDTQFRLIKSRAKLKYAELVQHAMNRAPGHEPSERSRPMISHSSNRLKRHPATTR
jgi:RNA polymerase sigma-70 factor (ECF subfamily)